MNISLTPELEQLVLKKVRSGLYQTSSEVIREGLRLLIARDEEIEQRRARLRAEVDQGLASLARGEGRAIEEGAMDGVKAEIKARGRARRGGQ